MLDSQRIETADLGILEVAPHAFTTGQTVRAMIRPEAIVANPASDVANQTPTTLIEHQFLGAQQRLHLLCGTTTLSLESASPPEIITHVALPPTHIHLFNR